MALLNLLPVLIFASSALAYYSGEFIPKSYYVIDEDGHKSDVVYFRSKRDVDLFPLFRLKRAGGSSSSSAQSSASSSASSSSSGGGQQYFGDDGGYNPGFVDPDFSQGFFGGNGGLGAHRAFASRFGGGQGGQGGQNAGYNGPILFSRFGEEAGNGIKVSGSAAGPNGAFSSTSSSSKDGKVSYSVQSGKY